MIRKTADPCEFCQLQDGAHASTCALLLLARDLEIHAGGVIHHARPLAAFDASDRRERDAELWPTFINLPGA